MHCASNLFLMNMYTAIWNEFNLIDGEAKEGNVGTEQT
jgi:hypothetical protein